MLRPTAVALTLAALALPLRAEDSPVRGSLSGWSHGDQPGIRIWTSHGEVYRRGERVRLYFRTERDAYVMILRADSDGRLRVLFPRVPSENNYVRGGATYDVPNYGRRDAFVVDDDPGVGYVFAVAAQDQFRWDPWTSADHWQLERVSDGRIHGDPYSSLEELVQRILPEGYADYDTHLLPYHVEQRYDYPRFVCYDCHSYVGYSYWNPYRFYCPRFTLFVYNDPYYFYPSYWYPTRYYGGTRVVYVRPGQRDGRYVFKAREDQTQPGIAYRDRRADARTGERRPADRGVRGADIGGVGSVAVPGRRLAPTDGGSVGGGPPPGGQPAERTPVIGGGVPGRRTLTPGGATTGNPPAVNPGTPTDDRGRRRTLNEPSSPGSPSAPSQPRQVAPRETGRRGLSPDPYSTRPTPREPPAQPSEPPVTRGISRPEWRGSPQTPKAEPRQEPRAPEARPEPRAPDSRPAPRAEPRSEPSDQPRAEPRQEPRAAPAPRAEPRQEPRAAPAPRAEPRAAPAPRQESPRSPSPTLTRRRP